MSLTELLDKKARLNKKIEAEENRVRSIEDRKLLELQIEYNEKQAILTKWKTDCREYLIDQPAVERFNALMERFTNERIKYNLERDLGHVTGGALKALEPKSFKTLISLYRLENWFNELNSSCDTAQCPTITEKEVLDAKDILTKYTAKISKRRGN